MSQEAERRERDRPPEDSTGFEALRQSPGVRGPTESFDDHDHANDHFALVYEDREEQFDAAIPFVRQGLERGEKCVFVADDNDPDDVLAAMHDRGIDVDSAREDGALSVLTPTDTYRRTGEFDRQTMEGFWEESLAEARDDGFTGLRAAAEMTWALDGGTDSEDLIEYEALLNPLYEDDDYVVLCQYNHDRFPATVIDEVIETHPHLIHDGTVYHNFYYTPPTEFFGPDDLARDVDRKLGALAARSEARTDLRDHETDLRELYEVTADTDLSFEETVERLLELGCDRFDLRGGALTHLPTWDEGFRAQVTLGPELGDPQGELHVQPAEGCFCRETITRDEPVAVPDTTEVGWDDDPVFQAHRFRTYFGMRVTVGDEPYGTLWFYDRAPRDQPFTEDEHTFLELMGQWVSTELERERREARLRQSREHFRRIFEHSHDAIFIVDPEADRIVDANPAASEMLGWDPETLRSLGPSDVHDHEAARFRAFVDDVLESGAGWTDELSCATKDGGTVPVEISASRMSYDDRPVMLAVARDISERRARERAQRRLYEIAADTDRTFEEKLQAVLDLGCDHFDMDVGGMARVDPDADRFEVAATNGGHDHLVPGRTYPLSETYCQAAVTENGTCAVVDPHREGLDDRLCFERFGVESYIGTHLEFDSIDDRTFWFVSGDPKDEGFSDAELTFHHLMGQWLRYELERRQYEEELERTVDSLRQSNDRLKQFAYAASHDLQEPLRMVSSYLQLLESEYRGDLDDTAREYIDFAVDGADRMRAMVDDLLAFSRVEHADREFERVDCEAVLEQATTDLADQIEATDVVVESLPTVVADPQQLELLFRNLVSNAVKYGGEGHTTVEISATDHGDHWEFAVADDGIGIDPDKTDDIFKLFKRLHHDDEYPGTGIGLALCQEIVEHHGGYIWVESEPGTGSTFSFTLPRREAE